MPIPLKSRLLTDPPYCSLLFFYVDYILRFENSAMFETPPLGRIAASGKDRQAPQKREFLDPFEGLEKYGINAGNTNDENGLFKKRKR